MSEERFARMALTRLMEPQDAAGYALVAAVGPVEAFDLIKSQGGASVETERAVQGVLAEHDALGSWKGLGAAMLRWRPRLAQVDPERYLRVLSRLSGGFLMPGDPTWPEQLDDLGLGAPLGLWWRGQAPFRPPVGRSVALVGSRDASSYGGHVASQMAYELAGEGYCVISGGAYGIDAHAHRSALAAGPATARPGHADCPTIAVMAGGLDRFYPSGNDDLIRAIADAGVVYSEVPPGSAPTRFRFLQRNRVIAALAGAVVVVEARWRSGALNTAHHAAGLGRAVAAVPGPVTSPASAGCHRLIREESAILVTDTAEVKELLAPLGHLDGGTGRTGFGTTGGNGSHDEASFNGLNLEDLLLFDSLPLRSGTTVDKLVTVAGLAPQQVRAGLGRLQLLGLASSEGGTWRKTQRNI